MASDPLSRPAVDRRSLLGAAVAGIGTLALGGVSTPQRAGAGRYAATQSRSAAHVALARAFYTPFITEQVAPYDRMFAPDWIDRPLSPSRGRGVPSAGARRRTSGREGRATIARNPSLEVQHHLVRRGRQAGITLGSDPARLPHAVTPCGAR